MPPKYAHKDLPPCPADLSEERVEQGGPFWDLRTIQAALRDGALEWALTSAAEEDLRDELQFDDDDLDAFLQELHAGCCRQRASQWCVEPATAGPVGRRIPRLADVYVMGFQRATRRAQPGAYPAVYVKFTVTASTLLIYSAHYERPQEERFARR